MLMIVQSSIKRRPIFKFVADKWQRIDIAYSSDGNFIYIQNQKVDASKLTNITPIVGVVAYLDKQTKTVYDFSSSHLCQKQLALIRNLICNF